MEIGILFTSFLAGLLTILAPCAIPILPVIIGSSSVEKNKLRPLIIVGSLGVSVIIFTLLLKASATFIDIPDSFWKIFAGTILAFLGVIMIFPNIWEKITLKLGFSNISNIALGKSSKKEGIVGDILVGAALGPVFSSCSPTYFWILATVLPVNFAVGFIYLIVYALGLVLMLLTIAVAGQKLIQKLGWATNPKGIFKRVVGAILLAVGIAVIFGLDKKLEAWLLEQGFYDALNEFEIRLIK